MSKLTPAQLRAKAANYLRDLQEIGDALGVSKTQAARMCQPLVTHSAVYEALESWVKRQTAIEEVRR